MNCFTNQTITIGIDAGGTFTDLVLFDAKAKAVLRETKVPTCHHDMLKTLQEGIDIILDGVDVNAINMVNFATTFATNAIVENKMRPTHLIVIGYQDSDVERTIEQAGLEAAQVTAISGGHTAYGIEVAPLDEAALTAAIAQLPASVEAVAISSFFSTRNPEHELRATQLIQNLRPDLPVSSGHKLTWQLDAIKRATTALLNAGLIPIIMELIDNLMQMLRIRGIDAPLTVLRGDGTAVGEAWAKAHPVELLLSGPAASAVGAGFLAAQHSGVGAMWICDIGGTTADIIALDDQGKPAISKKGAVVGSHQTLVKNIDIFTFGQGGDSYVEVEELGNINIGPMRIQPLCVCAEQYPSILEDLERLEQIPKCTAPLFVLPSPTGVPEGNLNEIQQKLLEYVGNRPISLYDLAQSRPFAHLRAKTLVSYAKSGAITIAGFTPTDAFHVLGTFQRWNQQASVLGSAVLCHKKAIKPIEMAQRVHQKMVQNIASALFRKNISNLLNPDGVTPEMTALIDRALDVNEPVHPMFALQLNSVLVGAGAPAGLVIADVAPLLHCPCILTEQAKVAGAIGAAVGTYSFAGLVYIFRPTDEFYRLHHPTGIMDFENLDDAVAAGQEIMEPWLMAQAKAAGAPHVTVNMERLDLFINKQIYLWTELEFTVKAVED
ncbi:hydantoinase/oxoprolinase family protein [Bengtsoniella intestinalis]|uniref:hydantoinase/oxoprolinase N-terminal domain-containing protein n=1 Tax=Bengtsoniella intestinalis TaxID=3073143 RepID=UPI00391F1793